MKEQILAIMEQADYKPLTIDELYQALNLQDAADFTMLAKTLNRLVDEHLIIYNAKGAFALLSYFKMACGIIEVKDAGYAFLDTDFGGIFIPKDHLKGAITYDEVMVKFHLDKKGRLEGEVVRIIKRNTQDIIGIVKKENSKYFASPLDKKLHLKVYLTQACLNNASLNDLVKVKITTYYKNNTADGIVTTIYGNKNIPGLDITSLVLSSGVKVDFDDATLKDLEKIPDTLDSSQAFQNNQALKDRRAYNIISIDGDDAKDLDDAICVKRLDSGDFFLGVYIADVSSYVKEFSALDNEAMIRGTSIYLPDRVIPMLPKKLSNGICSLNEKCDRLVMACEMTINQQGKVLEYDIFEAIINNKHRMTYQEVNQILEEHQIDLITKYSDIYPMLEEMAELAKILNQMRTIRGAFNFESVEPKLILDENGKVTDIKLKIAKTGEKLIEEFMLIANETVAKAMTWLDVPFIYRVHEEIPNEKMNHLMLLLNQFGYLIKNKNPKALPKSLQQILLDLNDEEDETKKAIISKVMVRSMAKAKYQALNIGHFGLASSCYTHFTSPIRRYPDLLVHRLIKEFMLGKAEALVDNPLDYFTTKVDIAANIASSTEKKAEILERDANDFKKIEYISNFMGQIFEGIISSVTQFGMYITLDNTIEGLVKYNQMKDDYYEVDDFLGRVYGRTYHKVYQIGDLVKVKLINADMEKRIVEFKLLRK